MRVGFSLKRVLFIKEKVYFLFSGVGFESSGVIFVLKKVPFFHFLIQIYGEKHVQLQI
jgi:hypothetical protein